MLLLRTRGEYLVPRYLSPEDAPWIEALIAAADAHIGRTVLERAGAMSRVARSIVEQHHVPEAVVAGVRLVLEREYKTEVASPRPPAEVRRVLFEQAALGETPDYDGALLRASEQLHLSTDVLLESLFADRSSARRVVAPERTLTAGTIVEKYDLALVESLLLRCESVTVSLREHVRAIARFARRNGLICTFAGCDEGGRFEVSGPLALLRATTRYGHALFKFFGALATTAAYRLEARCVLDSQRRLVRIAEEDRRFGGATLGTVMFDVDTPVERALQRELARVDRGFQLRRSSEASAQSPDFVLIGNDAQVFVEVVEGVGPEYLTSRTATLPRNVVLCIDERIALPELGDRTIVRYRRRIDPAALIEAAGRLLVSGAP